MVIIKYIVSGFFLIFISGCAHESREDKILDVIANSKFIYLAERDEASGLWIVGNILYIKNGEMIDISEQERVELITNKSIINKSQYLNCLVFHMDYPDFNGTAPRNEYPVNPETGRVIGLGTHISRVIQLIAQYH
jgi:hypothetical protein